MHKTIEVSPYQPETDIWNIASLQNMGLTRDQAGVTLLFHDMVEPFYVPASDYHNLYEHIAESFQVAMHLCDEAESQGHQLNRFLVAIMVLGHDAGFNHDLFDSFDINEWGTKEHYHAHITGALLETLKSDDEGLVTNDFIAAAKKGILTTNKDFPPETIEEEILRLADISNTSSRYQNFVLKSCEFLRECIVKGAKLDLDMFRSITDQVMNSYFEGIKSLRNIDKDSSGRSLIERAHDNLNKFRNETPQTILRILGQQAVRFTDILRVSNVPSSSDPASKKDEKH